MLSILLRPKKQLRKPKQPSGRLLKAYWMKAYYDCELNLHAA